MTIDVKNVKVLREKTGAGMMDCKKALLESEGDFEKAKLLLISHVGRPKGKVVNNLSLKPIGKNLSEKLDQPIKLIKEPRTKD